MKTANGKPDRSAWPTVKAKAVMQFKNGVNYSADQAGDGVKVIGVSDFQRHFRLPSTDSLLRVSFPDGLSDGYFLQPDDLLFVRSNGNKALVGRVLLIGTCDEPVTHSGFTIRGRFVDPRIDPFFGGYFFASSLVKKQFLKLGGGTNISNLSQGMLDSVELPIPPLPEQQKIAAILSTWDRAIELTEKLIAAKQKRKKALMQQLLTSRRAKRAKIASVVQRVNDPIIPEPDMMYREIGIRSHGKGIFHKEAVTGRSLGNKRVYRVHADCFVFNVVFAWEQAIAKTTSTESDMIASHRFPMYEPINNMIDLDYLLYFFKMPRGKHLLGLASPGGAGRNRTLSQAGFLKTRIPLPPIDEQKRISAILTTADSELRLLERQRENFCLQKKGLMQQLLTGKVRVNVDAETVKG